MSSFRLYKRKLSFHEISRLKRQKSHEHYVYSQKTNNELLSNINYEESKAARYLTFKMIVAFLVYTNQNPLTVTSLVVYKKFHSHITHSG